MGTLTLLNDGKIIQKTLYFITLLLFGASFGGSTQTSIRVLNDVTLTSRMSK
ncbi:hypothetical protein [Leptospira alexanderi]|uniref:hypothetical protein n=1 Tax=Leptospira alexanderi TaxID=100053 RepID=UPI00030F2E05|nr:hypothetical protein [Leptospira alexanderi]